MLTQLVPFVVLVPGLVAAFLVRRHGLMPGYVILGLVMLWAVWRLVRIWPVIVQAVSGTENAPLYEVSGEISTAPSWHLLGYGGVIVAALVVTAVGILIGWKMYSPFPGAAE
jgi:hypothetical protein